MVLTESSEFHGLRSVQGRVVGERWRRMMARSLILSSSASSQSMTTLSFPFFLANLRIGIKSREKREGLFKFILQSRRRPLSKVGGKGKKKLGRLVPELLPPSPPVRSSLPWKEETRTSSKLLLEHSDSRAELTGVIEERTRRRRFCFVLNQEGREGRGRLMRLKKKKRKKGIKFTTMHCHPVSNLSD